MKSILFTTVFFFFLSLSVTGQEPLKYTEVIQMENIPKNELYNRTHHWFTTQFKSSKDVIQIDNKEEGEIVGKGNFKYIPKVLSGSEQIFGDIVFTVKVFLKDGRYKYEFTDFIHEPYGNEYGSKSMGIITTEMDNPNPEPLAKGWSNKVWVDIKNQIDVKVSSLITSLKVGMNTKSESKNTDW